METGWRRNYLRYKSFFLNMMTQYRERSDWRVYLEILLSLATISVFSIFALRPTILTIAELITQIEEKKSTVSQMNEKIQNLGKAQIIYDSESTNITLLTQNAIPNNPNSDVFARQIEGLTSKHRVSLSSILLGEGKLKGKKALEGDKDLIEESESEEEKGKTYSETLFSVIATSSVEEYESLANFASDFEELRVTPIISTLDLSLKEEDSNTEGLVLLIEGKLPYIEEATIK